MPQDECAAKKPDIHLINKSRLVGVNPLPNCAIVIVLDCVLHNVDMRQVNKDIVMLVDKVTGAGIASFPESPGSHWPQAKPPTYIQPSASESAHVLLETIYLNGAAWKTFAENIAGGNMRIQFLSQDDNHEVVGIDIPPFNFPLIDEH